MQDRWDHLVNLMIKFHKDIMYDGEAATRTNR